MTSRWTTPRDGDLALREIASGSGLRAQFLPNGTLFSLHHAGEGAPILLNQVLGSPHEGGLGRLLLRVNDAPLSLDLDAFGLSEQGAVWRGHAGGLRVTARFWLAQEASVWFRRIEIENTGTKPVEVETTLVQDVGLGERGFLMNNEAYVSQYIDFTPLEHAHFGPVIACRQNLAQGGRRHPWLAIGCLDGAARYATDGLEIFGTGWRDGSSQAWRDGLPNTVLQHEMACVALAATPRTIGPGETARVTFFGWFEADHPEASGPADFDRFASVTQMTGSPATDPPLVSGSRGLFETAPNAVALPLEAGEIEHRWPTRFHEEVRDGVLLSCFVPDGDLNRHVVFRAKEFLVRRRHGAMLRSGTALLPDDDTLCATAWMHGVFAAQLTIGNTSFHKLFSVSRDPYNVLRASGLRVFVEGGEGWQLLAVPSAFEIGLQDVRWIYRFADETIELRAYCPADRPAWRFEITTSGASRRFLIAGHLVLGEREYDHNGIVDIDDSGTRAWFRPDPAWLWGQSFPHAAYAMVSSTPEALDAVGGDELLEGGQRTGTHIVFRTRKTNRFCLAVTGSMHSPDEADRRARAETSATFVDAELAPAHAFWRGVLKGLRLSGEHPFVRALDTSLPWLVHDALMHVTVPRGLEQYTGAAWGTRDVCQGPLELYLALGHDEAARDIIRRVFAQQYEGRGDWPQWFMFEPYSFIQDTHSHGDVIVWPLKALNDYVETTGDHAILDLRVPYRRLDDFALTADAASLSEHVDLLLKRVTEQFIPGTSLIRYGEGDWNDSLQPADPTLRERMVSSWTVALLYQQLERWSAVLARAGRAGEAAAVAQSAAAMRADFRRHLLRDGVLAGYARFGAEGSEPELMMHPADRRTGLRFSLLPIYQAILADLLEPDEIATHLAIVRDHLLCPDGVRLMDRPPAYCGGPERVFRRAESASNVGREIGLLYMHAHLRYGEAMAKLGNGDALWWALETAHPIQVTECVTNAALRQRNAYFSSSDAAFRTRHEAGRDWQRVRDGTIPVEGGWRIYSSGPGLYIHILMTCALGRRRLWGKAIASALVPERLGHVEPSAL